MPQLMRHLWLRRPDTKLHFTWTGLIPIVFGGAIMLLSVSAKQFGWGGSRAGQPLLISRVMFGVLGLIFVFVGILSTFGALTII